MVVADLHVHTTASDGSLEFEAVPAAAERAGVDVVAITDHDRVQPQLSGPIVERERCTLIHGIELRVDAGDQRVDLLGYGVEPTVALERECRRIQGDRVERGRRMIELVEAELGVDLDLEPEPGFGRPHVALALEEHDDLSYTVEDAFTELLHDGGPCYVPRNAVPSFERGRDLLVDACAVVGLAHPLRYPDPEAALELTASLDAAELHYPYGHGVSTDYTDSDDADGPDPVETAVERHDLLATGGSDAHDETLGVAGLDAEQYAPVASALGHDWP